VVFALVFLLIFTVLSLMVTKYLSSLARNVAILTYPFILWIVSIIIGWEKFILG
jgi:hypothetical protein